MTNAMEKLKDQQSILFNDLNTLNVDAVEFKNRMKDYRYAYRAAMDEMKLSATECSPEKRREVKMQIEVLVTTNSLLRTAIWTICLQNEYNQFKHP